LFFVIIIFFFIILWVFYRYYKEKIFLKKIEVFFKKTKFEEKEFNFLLSGYKCLNSFNLLSFIDSFYLNFNSKDWIDEV